MERLGLDEVFLDVTDIISYNQEMLNPNAMGQSFFQLSRQDPERGFAFDATSFFGCTYPKNYTCTNEDLNNPLYIRLLLASHLAGFLRHRLEEDFGYTSTCGVSINKILAKLAGTKNKPKNQTVLVSIAAETVQEFMKAHRMREVPGLGFKITHLVENHVFSRTVQVDSHDEEHAAKITVREALEHSDMSSEVLERILSRPGTESGIGLKVWNLLRGVDDTDVKEASDVPTQISIEDTYMSKPINSLSVLMRELRTLTSSLVRRMHVDLLDEDLASEEPNARRWLAYPKTLRLSTRTRSKPATESQHSFSRNSRSQPLPNFVFSFKDSPDSIVERLINEAILPQFRRLHNERQGWNLALINICVTNMVLTGSEDGTGGGRDISSMFKTQDARFKEFTVYDAAMAGMSPEANQDADNHELKDISASPDDTEEVAEWEEDEEKNPDKCPECGCAVPVFALAAHERFHAMGS